MAQLGYTPILLYSSSTSSSTPNASSLTNSTSGSELAVNITDGKLFYKDNTNTVQVLATKGSAAGTFSSVTITGGTINGTSIGATTPSTGAFTTLSTTGLATLNSLALGLTGYLYGNGGSAVTASTTIPTTALSGTVTNAQLANSSVTIGTTNIALGATSLTLGGLTNVTVTQDPSSALQLATKQYVDAAVSNVNYHAACYYATTADLGTVTYNNGASGVGATITNAGTQATLIIDGHTFTSTDASNAVRILVKNESNAAYNGIYTLTNQGSGSTNWVLTRATDYDQAGGGANEIAAGDTTFIVYGTVNASTQWTQTTPLPITIGTTAINFVQIGSATSYSAGTGLTLIGTQFSITNTAVTAGSYTLGNFTVNAQGQLTAASSTATTGSGNVVLATSPTLVTPNLGTPSALVGTNITGTASGLSIGGNAATATTATNATNVATSTGTATTNYLAFVTTTSGNNGVTVNSGLTYNGTSNAITGGINGGTF